MTSPGVCVGEIGADFSDIRLFGFGKRPGVYDNITISEYPKWTTPEERFSKLSNWALQCVTINGVPAMTSLEGYAYAARGKIFEIGENTGMLKYMLWKNHIPFMTMSPSSIKKSATGKGNANKQDMVDAFMEYTDCDIADLLGYSCNHSSPVSDLVDAFWIYRLTCYHISMNSEECAV